MRKAIFAAVVVAAAALYVVVRPLNAAVAAAPVTAPRMSGAMSGAPSSAGAQAPAPPPTTTQNTGAYQNGTYTGSVAHTIYGDVQVQVTVMNGRLADVTWLAYPQDRGASRHVSHVAMPILTQEALAAQSAQVSTVSGATQISEGFIESLSTALAQA